MSKLIDWLRERKKRRLARYDEVKKEMEKLVGRPNIHIILELPEEFEEFKTEFLALESNTEFHKEIQKLVKQRLAS